MSEGWHHMPGKLLVRPLELAISMIAKHKIISRLEINIYKL